MKNLGDIIDDCMSGKKPEYDELRYAICAMDALMTFDRMTLSDLVKTEKGEKKPILSYSAIFQYKERFDRIKKAFSVSPKKWLGVNNDPDLPEVQTRRRKANKLVEKIINKQSI